jgi:hypothetical protein
MLSRSPIFTGHIGELLCALPRAIATAAALAAISNWSCLRAGRARN